VVRLPEESEPIKIEIEPELSACIETKAKREYQSTLSEILKGSDTNELQEKLQTLRLFLQNTDFKQLREEYEKYLLDGRRVKFILDPRKGKSGYEVKIT
jgi:hypothetical protein